MNLNKVMLIGRLGRDPEAKNLPKGGIVTKFSLATSEKYNNEERTEWTRCTAFGKLAEVVKAHLLKGSLIYVEGRKVTQSYEDKDGHKKEAVEVVLSNLIFLEKKREVTDLNLDPTSLHSRNDDCPF